jgi:hypothetical protein
MHEHLQSHPRADKRGAHPVVDPRLETVGPPWPERWKGIVGHLQERVPASWNSPEHSRNSCRSNGIDTTVDAMLTDEVIARFIATGLNNGMTAEWKEIYRERLVGMRSVLTADVS